MRHRDSNKCSVKMECYMLELYRDDLIDLLLPQGAIETPKLEIKKDKKGYDRTERHSRGR